MKKVPNVSQLTPHPETGAPQLDAVPYKLNDFDENAVEAAVQLKEKHGGTVTLLTASRTDPRDVLPKAFAMGADRAIAVVDDALSSFDSLGVAHVLGACIKKHVQKFDLILCGEGSVDDYNCQIGPRLAELLSIPCITYASKLWVEGTHLKAVRTLESRLERVSATLPALATVGMEVNKPRYVSLIRVMAASRRPVTEVPLRDLPPVEKCLGMLSTLKVSAPKSLRKRLILVGSPEETSRRLVHELTQEGVI